MADPSKLAALQELATTGSFSTAQGQLGQSKDEALARQSSLGGLIGAPGAATASTLPTVEAPYGRFNQALQEYQGAYDQSAATLGAANDQYFAQVADAQAAHRAEANRAIAEAQQAATRRSGSGGGGGDLSQWEIEAMAGGLGSQYQQDAVAEQGQVAEQNQADADIAAQLDAWRTIGDEDAQSQRSVDYELNKQQANDEERQRAEAQWFKDNPDPRGQYAGTIQSDETRALDEQRRQAREAFINEWAGSDRLGGPRSEREQQYRDEVAARQDADIMLPGGQTLSTQDDGEMLLPDGTRVERNDAQRYVAGGRSAAQDALANQIMLERYQGPEFKRQAAMDLQLLGPDVPPELAEIQFRGMFPDMTPQEQMDAAIAQRELDYFNQTGFEDPQSQRSWEEAERKRAGEPDPNSDKVRRPDDPDVMRMTGLDAGTVERLRNDPEWEAAIGATETFIDPPEEFADQAVYSPAALKMKLEAQGYSPEMVNLIVTMYAPSMVG